MFYYSTFIPMLLLTLVTIYSFQILYQTKVNFTVKLLLFPSGHFQHFN